ncbi:MAG: hypothetical protein ACPGUE_09780 [Marinomonas sp.]
MKTKAIIEELIGEEKPFNIISSTYDNKIQKWSLATIGLCISIGVPAYFINPDSIFIGIAMITVLLMVIVFSVNNTIVQMKYILSPAKEHLSDLSLRAEQESVLVQRLTVYDSWNLKQAKQRLQFEADRLEKRTGALVGAMDKLGLFPAIIALYIAYSKTFGVDSFTDIPYLPLGFIAGLYLAAFSAVNVIGRLRAYSFLIEIAEDLSDQASKYRNSGLKSMERDTEVFNTKK